MTANQLIKQLQELTEEAREREVILRASDNGVYSKCEGFVFVSYLPETKEVRPDHFVEAYEESIPAIELYPEYKGVLR